MYWDKKARAKIVETNQMLQNTASDHKINSLPFIQ